MEFTLNPIEVRVLGCLIEKDLATPEYYPLTLNALTNACNQKSNRDPVLALEEADVVRALDSLRFQRLAHHSAEGVRAAKYCHNLEGLLRLEPQDLAVLAELLLRGPQTVGELRGRAERMRSFADLAAVEETLGPRRTATAPGDPPPPPARAQGAAFCPSFGGHSRNRRSDATPVGTGPRPGRS